MNDISNDLLFEINSIDLPNNHYDKTLTDNKLNLYHNKTESDNLFSDKLSILGSGNLYDATTYINTLIRN